MQTFKDKNGKSWDVNITLQTVVAVKSKLKEEYGDVNLLNISEGDPPLMARLELDLMFFGEVMLVLLEDQIGDMSEADVLSAFDGDTIRRSNAAFMEELINFFQSQGATSKAAAIKKQSKAVAAARARATKIIEERDFDLIATQTVEKSAEKILGDISGKSPESSE